VVIKPGCIVCLELCHNPLTDAAQRDRSSGGRAVINTLFKET